MRTKKIWLLAAMLLSSVCATFAQSESEHPLSFILGVHDAQGEDYAVIGPSKIGRQASKRMIPTRTRFGFTVSLQHHSPIVYMVSLMKKRRKFAFQSISQLEATQTTTWFSKPILMKVMTKSPISS